MRTAGEIKMGSLNYKSFLGLKLCEQIELDVEKFSKMLHGVSKED